MDKTPVVSVVGASGYSGIELLRFLARHSSVRIGKLFAHSSAGKKFGDLVPLFSGNKQALGATMLEPYSADAACSSDLVFIALPSGEAMRLVPELLSRGKKVIDLGGDFRLQDAALYEYYYKREHTARATLNEAVYGLPEWNREAIRNARLVANPGCYPTSALFPLLPLLKQGLIRDKGIVIHSLSGVSGAGRSSSPDLSFAEVNESVKAYKVGVHQHIPEIRSALAAFSKATPSLSFVPHLLPITRGIHTTISAPLARDVTVDQIDQTFQDFYGGEPFVRTSSSRVPEIKHVTGTNFIDIGFHIDKDNNALILLSVIDNLVKGAAGQAIQNMNLMLGFDETEGLL